MTDPLYLGAALSEQAVAPRKTVAQCFDSAAADRAEVEAREIHASILADEEKMRRIDERSEADAGDLADFRSLQEEES